MKEGLSLQDLAIELQNQRASMRDFKAPTNQLSYDQDSMLHMGDENHFTANNLFMRQLTAWADIPKKYVDRMQSDAPDLLSRNLNHWLKKNNETRLVRTIAGTARAFLSHRYRIIDNIDVVESVLPVFAEHQITTVSQQVTENHLYLKAVNTRKTFEIKRGDAVQFGVVVSNSEVGLGAVHVDPLVYRLVCDNGAIMADAGLRKFHIGRRLQELDESMEVFKDETIEADNKAFFLKLRDVVTAAFDETQMMDVMKSIEEGTNRKLGEGRFLEEVVEVTSTRYGLNGLESEGILRRLIEGRDLTQWGLANAVTNLANSTSDYERATDLERLGGTIMTLPEKEWEEIAS